ncbi:MAG TPA: hypothetical protein VK092_04105, partial [Deinococcales bacterium]|nr:hypothetical protein [Deinococcales bacterium]
WGAVATLTVIAAAVYGVNLYQKVFQGPEARPAPDLRFSELLVIIPFALGIIWYGLTPASAAGHISADTGRTVQQLELAAAGASAPLAENPEERP